jgi:hypothetical protein
MTDGRIAGANKRIKLADAFRLAGLGEREVAETYAYVVDRLRNDPEHDSVPKLLVEVLKECLRVLEPPRAAERGSADAPVTVQLFHNVPRPERSTAKDAK